MDRYNALRLEGLEDQRGNQGELPLTPEQVAAMQARLAAGPTPEDNICSLRGVDIQRILNEEFNLLRSLAGVYHLLHRLQQFTATIPEGEHAVMIWEGAGFHTSKQLRLPENVTLVQLPPYSPELNPIENLWHYLKSHFWSNRAYQDYDALEKAAMAAWKTAALDSELMKTVCAAPYLKRASSD